MNSKRPLTAWLLTAVLIWYPIYVSAWGFQVTTPGEATVDC